MLFPFLTHKLPTGEGSKKRLQPRNHIYRQYSLHVIQLGKMENLWLQRHVRVAIILPGRETFEILVKLFHGYL